MQSLYFWRNWLPDYRWLWYIFSGVFLFSLIALWFFYFQGPYGIIDWEKIQEQKVIETTVHTFQLGPFQLSVPAESYVIREYLKGSDIHHNFAASYIFLGVLAFSIIVMLTIITTLERFWYLVGMSLFIIFLVALRLEVLMLFGVQGLTVPIIVMALYGLLSYYFKSIRPSVSFIIRLASFMALTIVLVVAITLFASVPFPMLHLLITGYTPALILSILFIIMVAHEILSSFVFITGQGGMSGVKHFSLISFIYIVYIILTALHEMEVIHWDLLYVNVYLLISVSALLGIWGFKLRETLYGNIISFQPFGAYFFVALGSVCLITIAQLLGNANDATLKVIRDIVIFSHAGFGIIFLTYFISNFMAIMAENKPVYNLLYRPTRMPYFTFRFAGLIATLAFVFYSNWREYVYHSMAGFYNYVGDLYMLQGNEAFAISFYDQSRSQAFRNHRANYALATMKTSRLRLEDARHYYELANGKRPTEFSLVNEGDLFFWDNRYFDAIRFFRQSDEKMPTSPALLNNLGFAYGKIHAVDSSVFYLTQAREHTLTKTSAETNFFAVAATEYIPVKTDSIVNLFDAGSPAVMSNALAVATLFSQPLELQREPLTDDPLDLYSATLLNNYIIRNAKALDTTFIHKAYKIATDSINLDYSEALKASLAYAYYHQGQVYKALEILGELTYLTQHYKGKYNYVMGLWVLEQGSPGLAASYFNYAESSNYKHARFYHAIATTESGQVQEAVVAWDSILRDGEDAEKLLSTQMKKVLTAPYSALSALTPGELYQFCRYRITARDTVLFERLVDVFEDPNYKAQVLVDMAVKQFRADNTVSAIQYLNQVGGLQITDKRLYGDIRFLELQLLASRREIATLAKQINDGVVFDQSRTLEKMLYTALISESGDPKKAEALYKVLSRSNPFFEEGILSSADFFRRKNPQGLTAYNILVEAIHVNTTSIRLLKAYAAEASRKGFDDFALNVIERITELEKERR